MNFPIRPCHPDELALVLRQYRTNELVRRRMNFSSDAMADFEGLLEVNRKICKQADGGKGIAYAANELCGIALTLYRTQNKKRGTSL